MSMMVGNRRGIALLAALWLVVAIATVALALGVEAVEHRTVGLAAADRGTAAAAGAGAMAIAQARLEQVLRVPPRLTAANANFAGDPWHDADSLFPEPIRIGAVEVRIRVEDVASKININIIDAADLQRVLSFLLRDHHKADQLAQAIVDWRDGDDLAAPRGAERGDYLAHRRLDLPQNRLFRNPDELRFVEGMTPELVAQLRPYIRTDSWGTSGLAINVNTAPAPVLYAIPGVIDAFVARVMAKRSRRQPVTQADMEAAGVGIPGRPGMVRLDRAGAQRFQLTTYWVEIIVTVTPPPPGRPEELRRRIYRSGATVQTDLQ